MRHSIQLDTENQWAIIRYHGVVMMEDTLVLLRRLAAMPGWTPQCDRIVVYDDGLLGHIAAADFQRIRQELAACMTELYGSNPGRSAQVCSNPSQRALVEYWVSAGGHTYGAKLQLFETIETAQAWLREQRESAAD